jgi:hypothetical protein
MWKNRFETIGVQWVKSGERTGWRRRKCAIEE